VARAKWNEAPESLQVHQRNMIRIRTPKKSDGNLNLHSYKRGQVDELFVAFRKWLEEEVTDISRVDMCTNAQDDDSKLWIDKTSKDETKKNSADHQAKKEAKAAAIVKDNFRIEQEAAAASKNGGRRQPGDSQEGEYEENEHDDDDAGPEDSSQDKEDEENEAAETGVSGNGDAHSQDAPSQDGEAET